MVVDIEDTLFRVMPLSTAHSLLSWYASIQFEVMHIGESFNILFHQTFISFAQYDG